MNIVLIERLENKLRYVAACSEEMRYRIKLISQGRLKVFVWIRANSNS